MHRKADGTFTIEFTTIEQGATLPIQTEEGLWTHKDGIYITKTLKISGQSLDSKDSHYHDTYEIKAITNGVMTYHHPKMNITFTSKKVACERSAV